MGADEEKDITVGEIARHLLRIEDGIRDLRVAMGEYVLKAVHETQMHALTTRVVEVERDLERQAAAHGVWARWAVGLALTSVLSVLALIVAIFAT